MTAALPLYLECLREAAVLQCYSHHGPKRIMRRASLEADTKHPRYIAVLSNRYMHIRERSFPLRNTA